jgi:hypothetical protein
LYQRKARPESLFGHIFGEDTGYLVTLTAQQARLRRPDARHNELADTRQLSWPYPEKGEKAAEYLVAQAQGGRDTYFGVHLFREDGNRRATNAAATVRSLWLDEDDGQFPGDGPEPTAVVYSSASRRHTYWRLSRPMPAEWVVEMNRRIAAWAEGDSGKAALASVLRPPGTRNFKRHPQVDQVVGEVTGVEPWDPEVLEQAIPALPLANDRPGSVEPYDGPDVDLADYLENVQILAEVPDGLGVKLAVVCPWISEHSAGDRTGTYVGQRAGGGLWFFCHHQHCQARSWRDFAQYARSHREPVAGLININFRTGDPSAARKAVVRLD